MMNDETEDLKAAMEKPEVPIEKWNLSQVRSWLNTLGIKKEYIDKLYEEEVDGRILLELTEDFLKKDICMKSGPALLIINKRNQLIDGRQSFKDRDGALGSPKIRLGNNKDGQASIHSVLEKKDFAAKNKQDSSHEEQSSQESSVAVLTTKKDCKPRPFEKQGIDFTYIKHNVLLPESGVFDLISPCHEYKSFSVAAKLDRTRLQAKFAKELLKFATGCLNIRSNGTIHFGVMDSRDDSGYVHGEIIGLSINEKDIYTDALDYIGRSFTSDSEQVGLCIRPPQFIEVMDMDMKSTEKTYVVEVDIVPSICLVRNKVFSVRLPNFKESANKVEFEKTTIYRRNGSKTEPVIEKDQNDFYQRVRDRDAQREEVEHSRFMNAPDISQDLGRKLTMLITNGKKCIEKEKWYILVTNRLKPDDLSNINFLINMNIFCVFDFDPDSKVSGFCSEYIQHHAANMHFMQNYRMQSGMSISEFVNHLHLFEQTSWVFCNGRSDYKGNENPCDEMTWIKSKMTLLRESVSLICKQILPKGSFQVIFLLTSQVEKPLLHTFYEFFTDMEGHDDIICICESEENFQKWQSFAESSCGTETVNLNSVIGMKMSHLDATLQQIQPVTSRPSKYLPTFLKGQCLLETREAERLSSLEILSIDHCEETNAEFIENNRESIEQQFYHGGRATWLHFWLAEKRYVGEVIERDAFREISNIVTNTVQWKIGQSHVKSIDIFHHPGSGGSTVARQVLWNNRKVHRCAYVKPSYALVTVTEHAVQLREYDEKDPQECLPVLLLIEDCDDEYLDNLKYELEVAMKNKKVNQGTLCFILISCRRSHDPEKMCKGSPLQSVSVTHKLSNEEKRKFAGKRKKLEKQYQPEFILTFVLMSEEFNQEKIVKYVEQFVKHLLQGIDHKSVVTRIIHYVALLNTYVQNSFISQSHCEAMLALTIHMDRFRKHVFETSLSGPAKLVFIHLRDDKTYIESIRIIHPLVAKEILQQLLSNQEQQSGVAMKLLSENVLLEHRFGKDEFWGFLRALFIRRSRISKGDESDSLFSPLIEHVREHETPQRAIELLKEAYQRSNKDAFFAQQLARLNYTHERFEEAKLWAELAAKQMPSNSYILDTKGQVYRRWFHAKCKSISSTPKTAKSTADAVETGLKAMECFKECEQAAISDKETMNQSGFFAAVEVGCSLLKLIFSLQVFSTKTNGRSEGLKYLLTDYIPEEIRTVWDPFHIRLKNLHTTLYEALEWISDDLSFFQTEITAEDEEKAGRPEIKIKHPIGWLVKKSSEYGEYFSEATALQERLSNPTSLTPFLKRMIIYRLGGGNITSILSILANKKEVEAVKILEDILSLYPSNLQRARLPQTDLVNYIITQFALRCLSPQSQKVATLKDLQTLCQQFPTEKQNCQSSALFLQTLLFWPEDHDTVNERENKYNTVQTAVEYLKQSYWTKMKDIPQRKKRIYTHFFLSTGRGLDKFVHKSKVETITKKLSTSEKRLKWQSGELWKMPEIAKFVKLVSGWTEDETVYLEGPQKKKFPIPALNVASVPCGNENITFYLGFTFSGPVAYNIQVKP
ncbi:sterile alpha motif domain-containing protein 9-like [Aplochiton taeniatus]